MIQWRALILIWTFSRHWLLFHARIKLGLRDNNDEQTNILGWDMFTLAVISQFITEEELKHGNITHAKLHVAVEWVVGTPASYSSRVQISAQKLAILIEDFCDFP